MLVSKQVFAELEIIIDVNDDGVKKGFKDTDKAFDAAAKKASNAGTEAGKGFAAGTQKTLKNGQPAVTKTAAGIGVEAGTSLGKGFGTGTERVRDANGRFIKQTQTDFDGLGEKLNTKITPAVNKTESRFKRGWGAMASAAKTGGAKVQAATNKVSGALSGMGGLVAGIGIGALVKSSLGEAEDAVKTQAKLAGVLKQMGYEQHTAAVQDYAEALGKKIAVDNDEIAQVQMRLGTFKNVASTADKEHGLMSRATQAAYDMAAARGEDASAAVGYADMLGKALNSPEMAAALSRTGTLSKAEAKQIALMAKSGKTAQARQKIMEAVEKQYSGAAEKNVTATQKIATAQAALQEQLGMVLLPVVNAVSDGFAVFAGWMGENEHVMKFVVGAVVALGAAFVLTKAAQMAWVGIMGVWRAVTVAATAAQWLFNAAMTANPIGLIIIAVVAVIAAVVVMYQKFEWFRNLVHAIGRAFKAVWDGIVAGAAWVWDKVKTGFAAIATVIKLYVLVYKKIWTTIFGWIRTPFVWLWNFIKGLPGRVGGLAKTLVNVLTSPFRTAFNLIADLWNNTVGRFSFSIPDWVPQIGGNGFAMPQMPKLQGLYTGGVVQSAGMFEVGERGRETVFLPAGSAVVPQAMSSVSNGGATYNVNVTVEGNGDPRSIKETLLEALADIEKDKRRYRLQAVGV